MEVEKGKQAARLISECASIVGRVERVVEKVASSASLTNFVSDVHDSLESNIDDLVKLFDDGSHQDPANLTLSSIKIVLPDLVVAAALWVKGEKQKQTLNEIKTALRKLRENLCRIASETKLKDKLISYGGQLAAFVEKLKKSEFHQASSRESCYGDSNRDRLVKTREFLSQQIDERSHQIWTLGSLFVPVSFLIFAYSVTTYASLHQGAVFLLAESTGKILLMSASLACYLVWFTFYLRANRLNKLSYPLIHSLELILGIHGHLSLDEFRVTSRLLRITWPRFLAALYALTTLWVLLLRSSLGVSSTAVTLIFSFYVSTWASLKIGILKSVKRAVASILVYVALVSVVLLFLPAIISWLFPHLDPVLL